MGRSCGPVFEITKEKETGKKVHIMTCAVCKFTIQNRTRLQVISSWNLRSRHVKDYGIDKELKQIKKLIDVLIYKAIGDESIYEKPTYGSYLNLLYFLDGAVKEIRLIHPLYEKGAGDATKRRPRGRPKKVYPFN